MTQQNRFRVLVAGAALGLSACGGGSSEPAADAAAVSYSAQIQPIFDSLCVDCHAPGSAMADYGLTDPFGSGFMEAENSWHEAHGAEEEVLVEPGSPDDSFLVTKVADDDIDTGTSGAPMPLQVDRLTEDELAAVEQWIADGAQDDDYFQEEVAPIFGTEVTLRRTSGKCTWCHFPGADNGLSVIDVFDAEEGMVNVESRYGGLIVAPGEPEESVLMDKLESPGPGAQMPLHRRRLTEDEIKLIVHWIEQGAPNN